MSLFEGMGSIIFFAIVALIPCIALMIVLKQKIWTYVTVGVVGFFGLWLIAERMVETDKEKIQSMVYQMVEDLKQKKDAEVLIRLAENSAARRAVEGRIKSYFLASGSVSSVKVDLASQNSDGSRDAKLSFTATGRVASRAGSGTSIPGRAHFRFALQRKQSDLWKIQDIEFKKIGKNQQWQSVSMLPF